MSAIEIRTRLSELERAGLQGGDNSCVLPQFYVEAGLQSLGLSHRVLVRLGLDEVGGPIIWLRLFSVYRAILHQGQRGGEERVAMPPVTDPGPLSNQSQCRTNESPGPLALQKRKLENFELRLADEPRAFRPENWN